MNRTERDRKRKRVQRLNLSETARMKVREYDRNRKRVVRAKEHEVERIKIEKMKLKYSQPKREKSESFKASATSLLSEGFKSPSKTDFLMTYFKKKGFVETNCKRFSILKLKSYKQQRRHSDHQSMVNEIKAYYGSLNRAAKAMNVNYVTLYRLCKPFSKKVHKKTQDKEKRRNTLEEFYSLKSSTISFPHARIAHKKFMTTTYEESYIKYKKWCISKGYPAVSTKTFHRLKPSNVYKLASTPENQCTCIQCQNFKRSRKCIEQYNIKGVAKHSNEIILDSLCPVTDADGGVMKEFGKYECISRKCETCGFKKKGNRKFRSDYYEKKIKKCNPRIYSDKRIIKWQRWEFVTRKSKEGKDIKKLDKVDKSGSIEEFLEYFFQSVNDMALHMFNWKWHDSQFDYVKDNLTLGMLLQVLDFAQNYLNTYVDEPQGCHWDHTQTVIHPIVNYRVCPKDGKVIVEEHIIISDDLMHDKFAVKAFERRSVSYMKEENNFEPECIVQFCDNCSKQYKSKGPFQYISTSGVPTVRSYFGANHGKGPSDAATGRVKSDLKLGRKSRRHELRTAYEVFKFLDATFTKRQENEAAKHPNKCVHFKQKAFYVTDVDRSEPLVAVTTKSSKQFSSIRSTGNDYIIEARNVACCCPHCMFGDESGCPNKHYSGKWKQYDLRTGKEVTEEVYSHWNNIRIELQQNENSDINREGSVNDNSNENYVITSDCNSEDSVSNTSTIYELEDSVSNTFPLDELQYNNDFFNWRELHNAMEMCRDYNELLELVTKTQLPSLKSNPASLSPDHIVDEKAVRNLPQDAPVGYLPVEIYGDGNCCPRSICVALGMSPDESHIEMRCRMVAEGVSNRKRYFDNKYMQMGCENEYTRTTFPIIYADMSEYRMPFACNDGENLFERLIRWSAVAIKIYKKETYMLRKSGEWMGMWQLFQAANVINRPICSVYPNWLSPQMRRDMNRIIYPFEESFRNEQPVYIMWTSMSSAKTPNHFVPLLN